MLQGRQWEESGEYQRAVECYLKIDALATRLVLLLLLSDILVLANGLNSHFDIVSLHRDVNILAAAWTKAAEIAIKFLDTEKATGVAGVVGPRLVEIGRLDTDQYLVLNCHQVQCCSSALPGC